MSIFKDALDRPFPVTMLLLECVGDVVTANPNVEAALALQKAFDQTGLPLRADQNAVEYFAFRVEEIKGDAETLAEAVSEPSKESQGEEAIRTLGSETVRFINGLTNEEFCFYLADGDFERARKLYCEVDAAAVKIAGSVKSRWDNQQIVAMTDAVLYGMGGHYESDTAGAGGEGTSSVVEVDFSGGEGLAGLVKQMNL